MPDAPETRQPARPQPSRTLVGEVLTTQLIFAVVIGLIAVGCVWWIANWVVRDNLDDWSVRWVGELEALGAGLYVEEGDTGYLALANYVERFPEIMFVRYYDPDGNVIYVESRVEELSFAPLTKQTVERLVDRVEAANPHLTETSGKSLVRLSRAIATESLVTGDLFAAESLEELETTTQVIGIVELALDYSLYDRALVSNIFVGTVVIFIAFFVLFVGGRLVIARAVYPLTQLEGPLLAVADGDLDIEIPPARHREIAAIGNALGAAVANVKARDQHLRKLASYDQLTGLANRHHFTERLLAQMHKGGALVFIDLDQFKYVNDTAGHRGGDAILAQVAERLRRAVRDDDLVGRLGGDEFVMHIPSVSQERALRLAEQLLNDLREFPLSFEDQSFNVGCSIGIAMLETDNVYSPTELISQADLACRHAKNEGRNRVSVYEKSDAEIEGIKSDLAWQQRIKTALKEDHFELHYQPIMLAEDESVHHFEALLRLRDGEDMHFPDSFLPAAQRFGLMLEIDQWVIQHALADLAEHRKQHPDLKFSINVTGSTFIDESFANFVMQAFRQHKLHPSCAVFEITEQVAIGNFTAAVPQIEQLVDRGCEFAVDDFGTGYSSLSYLKRLPVQYIKIDGVFIKRLTESDVDQTIVRAIADIARIMNKRTIAEFVGDEATFNLIREIGIDYAQGWHVGKPQPGLRFDKPSATVVDLNKKRGA